MSAYPTGTVTFLFTDIEGSTKLWEQHPDEMQLALARHDAVMRRAIEAYGGYVFKTVGDAFCAAFATAMDALAATLVAQRALHVGVNLRVDPTSAGEHIGSPLHIRVRMGLHTGAAEERDSDYFGQSLNRVARLMSVGHGGQILLSHATYELVRDHLPVEVSVRDLGERRLKDLTRPERIYQIVAPDLPADFPALKTLDYRPNNLPAQTTPFIGREKEIEEVKRLVTGRDLTGFGNLSGLPSRLVTLTGVGGTGKTRLALQVAADLLDEFADGVFFVALASIGDATLVLPTIAQTLDVREVQGRTQHDLLKDYLREKQLLLVLDNFEQVLDAAPSVGELLSAAPRLKVIVTSRTLLRLYGEVDHAVPPLTLPDPKQLPSLERLTQYESVALFIERARAVRADFALTNENAPAVAEICARLDGLPLAIELAAARVRVLTPQKMLAQLGNRLRFLTGGARDLPARQQTLRGAIDWSHELLTPEEQTLFRRLSVFAGGCTLEAVEAVCVDEEVKTGRRPVFPVTETSHRLVSTNVLNGLESLVDKNLLKQNEVNGEPRFEMLETMREYAREKLLAAGEGEQTQARHLEFFTQLALTAEPALEGPNQVAWLNRLEIEHDNLRWALRWALEREDSDSALRLGGALAHFWTVRGHWSEGWQWLQRALEMSRHAAKESPVSRALRSKVLIQVDTLVWLQGDFGIRRALIEESLALSRELGDKQGMASSLSRLGLVALDQGDHATARALFQEGLVLSRELGDKQGIAILLHNLGLVARVQGDYAAAWALHQDSLALRREVSNKQGMAGSLNSLGAVAHAQGNHTSARALYQESLALYRELGDKRGIASSLTNLGIVAHVQGDYVIARALYQGGLTLYSELGYKRGIAAGLGNLGDLALMEGNYAAARTQYAESLTLMRELGNKLSITNCLVGWANLAQATGQVARATKLCGSVEASLQAIAAHLLSPEREMVERTVAALRAQIDEATFNALWTEGRAMSMEQAVAFALSVA